MSDQGLSIFDNEPAGADADAEATQVIPVARDEPPAERTRQQKPVLPPAPIEDKPAPTRPASA
ncbi:MAG: hypothetical protein JWM79_950, partial [Nocardioides sp.]|nr:hypothetical protein [Nocardioides sp.]